MVTWRAHLAALGGVLLVVFFGVWGVQTTVGGTLTEQAQADKTVGELVASSTAGQTFIAEHSHLSAVEIQLATYGRRNTVPITFHLRPSLDAEEDVITGTVNAAEIRDNVFHAFEFSPIRDSTDRSFYFYLEAPEAAESNAVTVWGTAEDAYPDGEAVLHGLDSNVRDLTFRLGYEPPLSEKVSILLDRLSANKPSLWGDRRLYVLLGIAYVGVLYVMFVQMIATAISEEDGEA